MPSTAYRYTTYKDADGTINARAQTIFETNEARLTYFGFDKFDSGESATDAFQIRHAKHITAQDPRPAWSDGRLLLRFNTLQPFRKGKPRVATPYEFGNEGDKPEPFTKSYPEYGKGGARQLIPDNNEIINTKIDESTILPSK